jgi:transposase InsO family protein
MDKHPYELFLQLEGIKHRTTQVRRPQSNGFVERFHKTILDEHFRIQGRSKWYESVEQMQVDLDAYLVKYNTQRPHQGRNMNGKTPITVFEAGLELVPEVNEEIIEQEMAAAE